MLLELKSREPQDPAWPRALEEVEENIRDLRNMQAGEGGLDGILEDFAAAAAAP